MVTRKIDTESGFWLCPWYKLPDTGVPSFTCHSMVRVLLLPKSVGFSLLEEIGDGLEHLLVVGQRVDPDRNRVSFAAFQLAVMLVPAVSAASTSPAPAKVPALM